MLKLRSKPTVTSKPPPTLTTLSVSWLNGQFAAVAVVHGEVIHRWVSPNEVDDITGLSAFLREAVKQTGYTGETVQMVLAHSRLSQVWLEMPAVKGGVANRFLTRQIQQNKTFEGPAAHGVQRTLKGRMAEGMVLHLAPKALLETLEAAVDAAGLILTEVLPASAPLEGVLRETGSPSQVPMMVAAEVGGQTVLVVGRTDGELCLVRTVAESWQKNLSRIVAEINRTLQFVSDQFGQMPATVICQGAGAPEKLPELQAGIRASVELGASPAGGDWLAARGACVAHFHPANLLGRQRQAEPKRRRLLTVTLGVVAVLVLGSSSLAWYFNRLRKTAMAEGQALKQNVARLSVRYRDLAQQHGKLTNYQAFVKELEDGRAQPVPAWFIAQLGGDWDPRVLLTNINVRASSNRWEVRLSGRVMPGAATNQPVADASADPFDWLTNKLAAKPFNVRLTTNVFSSLAQPTTNAYVQWAAKYAGIQLGEPEAREFRVEGRIQ